MLEGLGTLINLLHSMYQKNLAKSTWLAAAWSMTCLSYSLASSTQSCYSVLERSSIPHAFTQESCVCTPACFFNLNMHLVFNDFISPGILIQLNPGQLYRYKFGVTPSKPAVVSLGRPFDQEGYVLDP